MWGPSSAPEYSSPDDLAAGAVHQEVRLPGVLHLPLLTISCPVQCTRKSASLECCIPISSLLCHALLRLARPLPWPIWETLAKSTLLAARTAAVLKRRRMFVTSSPICWSEGGSPRRARVRTLQVASRVTNRWTPELPSPYAPQASVMRGSSA